MIENIVLNSFDNIIPVYAAISNLSRIDAFSSDNEQIAYSGSQLGRGEKFRWIPVLALDNLGDFDIPTYIKIDIDGQELLVIEGALKCINDDYCRGLLVEINQDREKIMKLLIGMGYVTDNDFNSLPNHSRYRREKEGIKAENVIFTRR